MSTHNDFDSKHRAELIRWLEAKPADRFQLIDESVPGTTRLVMKPRNPRACPLLVASKNGSTQWQIGRTIWFDEVDGLGAAGTGRLTSELTPAQLNALLNSVWNGAVKETIRRHNDVDIASNGEITIDGIAYGVRRHRKLSHLFLKADQIERIHYESY